METNDDILTIIIMLRRMLPRLRASSREPISRTHLIQVRNQLGIILELCTKNKLNSSLFMPLAEVSELIDSVTASPQFVETDADTKNIIVENMQNAYVILKCFAGEYYRTHKFTFNMNKFDILAEIVDTCIDNGDYFGYAGEVL